MHNDSNNNIMYRVARTSGPYSSYMYQLYRPFGPCKSIIYPFDRRSCPRKPYKEF